MTAIKEVPPDYRPDIDGLRAVAVLAVVGFHAEIGALRGGFIGVDVFFVISGYLITGIIRRSLQSDRFSFREFYTRRINRIIPALLLVLAASAVLGWFVLFSAEFASLGKHMIAGSFFYSNFALWSEAGYFDSSAKPLLHLWSLAVEEQFYLLWPPILLYAWLRRQRILSMIVVIGCVSFLLSIVALERSAGSAAFYLPVTRFWEILSGAGLCWIEASANVNVERPNATRVQEFAAVAGILGLGLGLALISESTPWPGWWALMPVAGTTAILYAGPKAWVNRRLLSAKALVGIGLISYPLYLWHWPLMVLARLVNEGQLSRTGRVWLIAVSIVLATATYKFVEMPIRFGSRKRRSAARLLGGLILVGALGLGMRIGFIRPRLDRQLSALADAAHNDLASYPGGVHPGTNKARVATIEGDSTRSIIFIGDSHVQQYWPRAVSLEQRQGSARARMLFVTHEGCPSLPDLNPTALDAGGARFHCDEFFRQALSLASVADVKTVVFGGFWENYAQPGRLAAAGNAYGTDSDARLIDDAFNALEENVSHLTHSGKTVFLLLSNPVHPDFNPDSILLPRRLPWLQPRKHVLSVPRAWATSGGEKVGSRLRAIARRTGAKVIDPADSMCDSVCGVVDEQGQPIYIDDNHMRAQFARNHASFIDPIFSSVDTTGTRFKLCGLPCSKPQSVLEKQERSFKKNPGR